MTAFKVGLDEQDPADCDDDSEEVVSGFTQVVWVPEPVSGRPDTLEQAQLEAVLHVCSRENPEDDFATVSVPEVD